MQNQTTTISREGEGKGVEIKSPLIGVAVLVRIVLIIGLCLAGSIFTRKFVPGPLWGKNDIGWVGAWSFVGLLLIWAVGFGRNQRRELQSSLLLVTAWGAALAAICGYAALAVYGYTRLMGMRDGGAWILSVAYWIAAISPIAIGYAVSVQRNRAHQRFAEAVRAQETRFSEAALRLSNSDPLVRAHAVSRLGEIALEVRFGRIGERTHENYPFYAPAASSLAAASRLEPDQLVRDEILRVLTSLARFDSQGKQELLHQLIFELAEANRSARRAFVRSLASYLSVSSAIDQELADVARLTTFVSGGSTVADADSTRRNVELLRALCGLPDLEGVRRPSDFPNYKKRIRGVRSVGSSRILQAGAARLKDSRDALAEVLRYPVLAANAPSEGHVWSQWKRPIELPLQETFLAGANLSAAKLQGANLSDALLSGARLWNVQAQGANFTNSKLTEANLYQAQLTGATLAGANLKSAILSESSLVAANFTSAQLQLANLRRAVLSDANLLEARLQGASLTGAQLDKTNLKGIVVQESDSNLYPRTSLNNAAWWLAAPESFAGAYGARIREWLEEEFPQSGVPAKKKKAKSADRPVPVKPIEHKVKTDEVLTVKAILGDFGEGVYKQDASISTIEPIEQVIKPILFEEVSEPVLPIEVHSFASAMDLANGAAGYLHDQVIPVDIPFNHHLMEMGPTEAVVPEVRAPLISEQVEPSNEPVTHLPLVIADVIEVSKPSIASNGLDRSGDSDSRPSLPAPRSNISRIGSAYPSFKPAMVSFGHDYSDVPSNGVNGLGGHLAPEIVEASIPVIAATEVSTPEVDQSAICEMVSAVTARTDQQDVVTTVVLSAPEILKSDVDMAAVQAKPIRPLPFIRVRPAIKSAVELPNSREVETSVGEITEVQAISEKLEAHPLAIDISQPVADNGAEPTAKENLHEDEAELSIASISDIEPMTYIPTSGGRFRFVPPSPAPVILSTSGVSGSNGNGRFASKSKSNGHANNTLDVDLPKPNQNDKATDEAAIRAAMTAISQMRSAEGVEGQPAPIRKATYETVPADVLNKLRDELKDEQVYFLDAQKSVPSDVSRRQTRHSSGPIRPF